MKAISNRKMTPNAASAFPRAMSAGNRNWKNRKNGMRKHMTMRKPRNISLPVPVHSRLSSMKCVRDQR